MKKTCFDFFLNRPIMSGIVVFLLALPIAMIGSFVVLAPEFGVRGEDPHGIGAFIFLVLSFVFGVSVSSASGLAVGVMLWNRRNLKLP